jgi:hypothetical protein
MLSSAHKINVAQLLVAAGQVADVKIDRIVPGPIHIDRLSLQGISADLKSAKALLKSVRLLLELQFSVDWWYNIGIWSDSGSDDLGKIFFPLPIGDVEVPSLSNIVLNIPEVSATNVTATIGPIVNFDLGGGAFTGVSATNAAIPTNGFQLSGLGLISASIGNVGIPQTLVDNVRIQDFSPSGNIVVPNVQLSQLQLPLASAGDVQSEAPIAIDTEATSRGLRFRLGDVFGFTFWVTPFAHAHIASFLLSGLSVSGSVDQASIQNITVPVDIQGISLTTINIGQIDANNITL